MQKERASDKQKKKHMKCIPNNVNTENDEQNENKNK